MTVHKLAMVGCGGVTAMHYDGYTAHPERIQLVAACDPVAERRDWAQQTYGVASVHETLDAMIDAVDWDVAVVCTPTSIRREMVEQLAAAGKHLMVEKPLADTYAEAKTLVDICAKANVKLAVNQNFREHYGFHLARDLVAEGRLGKVLGIVHEDLMFRQDKGWRREAERHALSVMGVHWLDGFRFLLGREASWVWCRTASSPAIDATGETEAFTHLLFDDIPVTYTESFSSRIRRTDTVVLGALATLRLGSEGVQLTDDAGTTSHQNPYAGKGKPESTYRCLDQLLQALDDGKEPANSGEDNLRTIALLDAAYASAKAGEPVTLTEGLPR
ncbi:Gfo/Idh/MocA family protein [Tenggerimyces flavus]|uniref:Gfo/Idh/MocA family protein n=1 Tax=Tenggerimyces flavus TaxID=1708749 RepID=A0ABV7YET4_9ACTN|nr:Gfo/Idh/MocA family oxidoreductase [Tenggerimyces flavus]MBM7789325.1 putative dehydrogenase [Tenggerimyces flavus]